MFPRPESNWEPLGRYGWMSLIKIFSISTLHNVYTVRNDFQHNYFANWMNEWMMHFYSTFIVYWCTPKVLYNHVGGSLLNHHQCAASTWMIFCWMKLPLKILFWLIWSAINHTTTLRSISHHSSQLFWCSLASSVDLVLHTETAAVDDLIKMCRVTQTLMYTL